MHSSHSASAENPLISIKANRFFMLNLYFFGFIVLAFFYLQQHLEQTPYLILLIAAFVLFLALYSHYAPILRFYTDRVDINPSFFLPKHCIPYASIVTIEQVYSVIVIYYQLPNQSVQKVARFSIAQVEKNAATIALTFLTEKIPTTHSSL